MTARVILNPYSNRWNSQKRWPEAEAAVVRRSLAPMLLGRDPSRIDELWADMFRTINYSGWAGAEMRAISAVDMALWDLAGKSAGLPVYKLLGTDGLPAAEMPSADQPVMGTIGYHMHTGGHGANAYDWEQYVKFLELHLQPRRQ